MGHSLIICIVMYGITPLAYVLQCMGSLPYHGDCNVWGHSLTIRIVIYGVTPLPMYCNVWGHSTIIRIAMYVDAPLLYVLQ